MPRAESSLRITDAYATQLQRVRTVIARLMLDRWRAMDPDNLDSSFGAWLPAAVAMLTQGQREAVRLSDAYLARFLSSELEAAVPPQGLDPDDYAGRTRDGRDVRLVLGLSIVSTKLALGQGRPMPGALDAGAARAVRASSTEVMEASRSSLTDAMDTEQRVLGYRRVVHNHHSCGACLALAGKRMRSDHALLIHSACGCTAEPIVEGVKERATRPDGKATFEAMTPAQQDRLFAGRGGAKKADLIRSGAASLDELVTVTESPQWGRQVYETPLEQLVS